MLVAVLVVGLGLTGIAIARENNASVAPADPLPDGAVSLFADDVQPKDVAGSENTDSIELGLRFTTSQTGTITGLRFFRTIGDFTAHGGRLWSANGEILGRLRFPPRLNPGWQYADFRSPVPVSAGDVLVASYHTSRDFAADTNYFADHLLANGPLSTVGTGASGSGVFAIGDHAIFPSSVYRASNYWVDPAFLQASDDSPVVPPPAPTPSPPAPTATPSPTPSPSPSPSPRPTPSPSPTPSPTPSPSPSPTPSPTPPPAPPPPPAPVPPPPAPVPPPAPGGTLAPNTIPAPGQVGFRGDRSTLRVIDSAANAPAGTRWSGSILEVTGQGVILDGVYVKGAITYGGSGGTLTIRNSVVEARSGAWAVIDVRNDSGNLIVSDSTIVWPANVPNPSNSWGNGAIHGDSAMTLIRNDISGTPDGIQQGRGDVRFEQNYIHDLRRYGDTHNDGIQLYGGPRVRVLYNRIELNGYQGNQNAALFLSDDGNGFTSPEIIGNYLSGGGFQLRLESGVQGAVVVGNRFGPLNGGWGEILISNGVTIARFEDNRTSSGALISL